MSDLKKPKKPKRPTTPEPKPKPKLELVRITPAPAVVTKPPTPPVLEPEPVVSPVLEAEPTIPLVLEPEPVISPILEAEPVIPPVVEAEPVVSTPAEEQVPEPVVVVKGLQPITPPTEILQYRAIGLVDGRFVPEEAEPNKGTLVTGDGQAISCVILGKMIAIINRKLQPDRSYLWVVYPRTQIESGELHLQIMGVWAPVELGKAEQSIDPGFPEGHFSVRGEVVQVEPEQFVVKIKRTDAKASANQALRKFKLKISGVVPPNTLGFFWDMQVRREGTGLQFVEGTPIELVPKKPFVRRRKKPRGKTDREKPTLEKPDRPIDRPIPRKAKPQS